jgi:integrase
MPREKKPTLKRRKDGRYRCVYHGIQFYGATPEEAFAARDEYKLSSQKGFSSRSTVTEYALPWLKRSYPSVADSTYTGLAIHLQHLIDCIGDKPLAEVIPSDLKQVYATEYKGLSNSYIRSAKQLFCALFDSAQADGLIRSNPARDKTAKPGKGKKPKERVLTAKQREYIETLCTDHRMHPAVMAMLYAGLRPQECKALNIDRDIDFEKEIITVQKTAHVDGTKYVFTGEGKTEWSNRQVPLFPPLKAALTGLHGHLITSPDGDELTIQAWKSAWESYIFNMEVAINGIWKRWYGIRKDQKQKKEAGTLPAWIDFKITPYMLRHAYCRFLRDSGVEINTARHWMGHADTKMILKVYDSVSESRSETERQKVEKMVFGVQNGVQDDIVQRTNIEK